MNEASSRAIGTLAELRELWLCIKSFQFRKLQYH
jgi:hypothetical protein